MAEEFYFINIVDHSDGQIKIWKVGRATFQKLLSQMTTEEEKAFFEKSLVKTYVCADCGNEQINAHKCNVCGRPRVILIRVVERIFGPDWRKCFE